MKKFLVSSFALFTLSLSIYSGANVAVFSNAGKNTSYQAQASTQSTTSTSYVDVTGLNWSLTSTGTRPILITLISANSPTNAAYIGCSTTCDFQILRDGTVISIIEVSGGGSAEFPPSTIQTIDEPAVGSHTYKVQMKVITSGTASINYAAIKEVEL